MRAEVFALTPALGGFSLTASSCRRRIYRIERLLRSLKRTIHTWVCVVSANTGVAVCVTRCGGLDLTSGRDPGALRAEETP